jgi:hypothetical protein
LCIRKERKDKAMKNVQNDPARIVVAKINFFFLKIPIMIYESPKIKAQMEKNNFCSVKA